MSRCSTSSALRWTQAHGSGSNSEPVPGGASRLAQSSRSAPILTRARGARAPSSATSLTMSGRGNLCRSRAWAAPSVDGLGGASDRALLQPAALPLAQAPPDAKALVVRQSVLEALGANFTGLADPLCLPSRATLLREEGLRVGLGAQRALLPGEDSSVVDFELVHPACLLDPENCRQPDRAECHKPPVGGDPIAAPAGTTAPGISRIPGQDVVPAPIGGIGHDSHQRMTSVKL